jgi:hypothetical protein
MENVGLFYDHLEYFTVIRYNLWQFGIILVILYFLRFGMSELRKICQPCS